MSVAVVWFGVRGITAANVCICVFARYDCVVTRGIGYKFVVCIDELVEFNSANKQVNIIVFVMNILK